MSPYLFGYVADWIIGFFNAAGLMPAALFGN
jgi:hypothetical protein